MRYDYSNIKLALEGKRLIGFMDGLKRKEIGDNADNGMLLLLGRMPNPQYVILESENQDYSMFDKWIMRALKEAPFTLDSRYKVI